MEENNENNLEATKPIEANKPKKSKKSKRPKKKFFERRFSWFLLGILLCLLILVIGAICGYRGGVNERLNLAETQAAPKIESQLESARQDIEEERYEVALSRLDWILEEMVEYLTEEQLEEVGVLYSQALLSISTAGDQTLTQTEVSTEPTQTPTPESRGEEELYTSAQGLIAAESWDEAIQTLESLREKNLQYKAVQVDGMFFVALRNRGVHKILVEGSLEPGLYDLALAEQFAPLDSTADGYRTYARLYLTGASYWGVDWTQVIYYFEQIYQALPNLRDGTNITAFDRYRLGLLNYGLDLAASREFCTAQDYFNMALALGDDQDVQPTLQWIGTECWEEQHPPTKVPPTATSTVAPTNGSSSEETETTTESPASTSTPTPTATGGGGG